MLTALWMLTLTVYYDHSYMLAENMALLCLAFYMIERVPKIIYHLKRGKGDQT